MCMGVGGLKTCCNSTITLLLVSEKFYPGSAAHVTLKWTIWSIFVQCVTQMIHNQSRDPILSAWQTTGVGLSVYVTVCMCVCKKKTKNAQLSTVKTSRKIKPRDRCASMLKKQRHDPPQHIQVLYASCPTHQAPQSPAIPQQHAEKMHCPAVFPSPLWSQCCASGRNERGLVQERNPWAISQRVSIKSW